VSEIIWSESALAELEVIAEYIALENRTAASAPVQRVAAATDECDE